MCGRIGPLTCLLIVLASPPPARAHKLEVDYRIKDRTVQIEGWYNAALNPHPARLAKVRVTLPDGTVVAEGELDEQGQFTFNVERASRLWVVLSQVGHRAEVSIPASAFEPPREAAAPEQKDGADEPMPPTVYSRPAGGASHLLAIILGVSLLLGAAGFYLGVRNLSVIRDLQDQLRQLSESHEGGEDK